MCFGCHNCTSSPTVCIVDYLFTVVNSKMFWIYFHTSIYLFWVFLDYCFLWIFIPLLYYLSIKWFNHCIFCPLTKVIGDTISYSPLLNFLCCFACFPIFSLKFGSQIILHNSFLIIYNTGYFVSGGKVLVFSSVDDHIPLFSPVLLWSSNGR